MMGSGVEWFDLTLPVSPDLPVLPGDPPVMLTRSSTHEVDGYEVTRVCLGSHSGTHVEAPRHFFAHGQTLDEFPLSRMIGRGLMIDYRGSDQRSCGDDSAGLEEQLQRHPLHAEGIVLLWTEGRPLSVRGAEMLAEAGVGLVGTDALSIDDPPYSVHRLLLSRGILIAEGLCGLDRLGTGPIDCAILPLALTGTDAAPARAIAWR